HHAEPGFAGESGGHHKEDQQQKHHINQRRQVHRHLILALAAKLHDAAFPSRDAGSATCIQSSNCTAACSMPTVISSTRRTKKRWKNSAGIATLRPAAVVISAVEIPPARRPASPLPCTMITENTSIMPNTVPSRPSSGAIA